VPTFYLSRPDYDVEFECTLNEKEVSAEEATAMATIKAAYELEKIASLLTEIQQTLSSKS
jgi:hypothetical protein